MTAELRRSIFLACVGLLGGFALVVTLYGAGTLFKGGFGAQETRVAPPVGEPAPGSAPHPAEGAAPLPGKPRTDLGPDASPRVGAMSARGTPEGAEAGDRAVPTFDIIRIEPTGETVIAGRAAPNTTVELLRDGQPIARALVDPSGQFALVPSALPPGSSEMLLRATGADGRHRVSRDSVAVVIAPDRGAKPLIALTSPDKPTIVLSQPDLANPPGTVSAGSPGATNVPRSEAAGSEGKRAGPASRQTQASQPGGEKPAPVRIVSVEAEEGGRLYVTGQTQPGATVRLYLNDTLVAPGSAGADGRVAFTIGRGLQAGAYRIRVDQIDSVTGTVKARSEVPFAVPASASGAVAALARPAQERPAVAASARAARPQAQAGEPFPAAPPAAPPTAEAAAAPSASSESGPAVFVPEIGTARIIRGDSLWQISRRIYGKGTRYTVIYGANQPQIRNPDLIYPGQIFVLPSDGTAAVPQSERRG